MADTKSRGVIGGERLCPNAPRRAIASTTFSHFGATSQTSAFTATCAALIRKRASVEAVIKFMQSPNARATMFCAALVRPKVSATVVGRVLLPLAASVLMKVSCLVTARRRAVGSVDAAIKVQWSVQSWLARNAPTPPSRTLIVSAETRIAPVGPEHRYMAAPRSASVRAEGTAT